MKRIAAIGTFDGVHRGHQSVLRSLTNYSETHGLLPMVVTFSNHPLSVIAPERAPQLIMPLSEKKKLIAEAGVTPVVLEFDNKLRNISAEDWITYMKENFGVRALVVGYDNTFGSDGRHKSPEDYKRLGEKKGVDVIIAEEIPEVSSSAIRKAVKEGDMPRAEQMLGRPFSITHEVVGGNHIGQTLGFPTANLIPPAHLVMPRPGVYAATVKALDKGVDIPAMVNIGVRPTIVKNGQSVIEAHLIGWEGNLYGKEITLNFHKRLRDEQHFDSIEALKEQLQIDMNNVLLIENI